MDEKMKTLHDRAIDEIKNRIGGWFGDQDGIFAGHPLDEGRAKEHRKLALASGISFEEIIDITQHFFDTKRWRAEHQEEQMKRVKKFFAKLNT